MAMLNRFWGIALVVLGGFVPPSGGNLLGQAPLSGTIWTSSQTGGSSEPDTERVPVPYAHVWIPGSQTGAVADSLGRFVITTPEQLPIRLKISAVGYEPSWVDLAQEPNGPQDWFLNPLALETVVVSASLRETYLSASPARVEVLSAEALATYLPTPGASLVESIALVNGVQEVVGCGVCFTNSISINGLPGSYTAVLLDGMPLYGSLAATYALNGIPNLIMDRVEVVKGPGSTLFGSEAVGGVINVITKDPAAVPALELDLMATQHAEVYVSAVTGHQLLKSRGYSALNGAYSNRYEDRNGDGFGDGVLLDRWSLFHKWSLHRRSGKPLTLALKGYAEDRRNGVQPFLRERAYRELRGSDSVYGESIYTLRAELLGTYTLPTAADLRLDLALSAHHQDSRYGQTAYNAQQRTGLLQGLWSFKRRNHEGMAGLVLRYQFYDDNTAATQWGPVPDSLGVGSDRRLLHQTIPGAFVQDQWQPHPHWTLLSGLRVDRQEQHGWIPAPRLALKWQPSPLRAFRFNAGTGFRTLNLFTEDHAFVTGQRQVVLDGPLAPERSWNTTLSASQEFFSRRGSGTLTADAFYTRFQQQITADYDQPGKIVYANSEGFGYTRGLAASLQYQWASVVGFQLSATWQDVQRSELDASGLLKFEAVPFAPRWSGLLLVNARWERADLTLAYTLRITGAMVLPAVYDLGADGQLLAEPRPQRSEPFAQQSVQLTKVFSERFSVYGGVQNLGNFRQPGSPLAGLNDPAAAPGFSPAFDTAYAYASMHGREAYLGLRLVLNGRKGGDLGSRGQEFPSP
ncbi:MAG: TonB-dependent receptor plug domain-containing protein [Bacteroidetes bacterium]|nr:TonB-dependent receptor plug domain-containing protein [Bacteroidota bacterium]